MAKILFNGEQLDAEVEIEHIGNHRRIKKVHLPEPKSEQVEDMNDNS